MPRRYPTPSQRRRALRLEQAAERSPAAARELERMVDEFLEGELEPGLDRGDDWRIGDYDDGFDDDRDGDE